MNIKALAVAPYPGLGDLLKEMSREYPQIEMDIETADLQEAVPIVKRAEQKGVEVIVSRGGTASLIREHVSIPVVDIPVSGYDMLRVLTLVKDSNSQVAIIGFPNVCRGAEAVSSLLDFEIPVYPIESEAEVRSALRKAFKKGVQIVLGDVVTVKTAQEMGCHGILITSGRESIEEAFAEVVRVCERERKGREIIKLYETVLTHDAHGIFIADPHGVIRYANRAAADLLRFREDELPGTRLNRVSALLHDLIRKEGAEPAQRIKERVWLHDQGVQVDVVTYRSGSESLFIFYLEPADHLPGRGRAYVQDRQATFAQIIGSSDEIRQTIKRAKAFAKTDKNIWITGEIGSGRSLFAQAIHSASRRNQAAFYRLSCGMDDDELEGILFGTGGEPGLLDSPLAGTIYLEEIGQMSSRLQQKLLQKLKNGTRQRMIVSSSIPGMTLVKQGKFAQELVILLGEHLLPVPPLRQRAEDIEEIARVLIAAHNSRYGKQIVGLKDEILEPLMEYPWPGNVKELENVVEEMLLLTNGHYVGGKEAEEVLERHRSEMNEKDSAKRAEIDLTGSWDEIERRILLYILREEGMNQSRAANRLGINRSTLWRKLRDVLHNKTI
ncbi:sigma-54-dependent Fis family transcriptional regulator [Lihuaxuella thermophila]|uniref:Transcriptional regulator containing PAS, AAA-type ATPase, and DNA-binding Fis domains n=1 Tax=Lihuaxuella thermophila TaxID=1173111 RepID=A0A1H8G4A7_9BACL|nr:PrpR N-terminal domain-containing protein [Lihuaxuella thermophila]SEN38719.1 Transcriptional regulator containing PAS, AAA-type ATPase, and DNA-binding Fis domains [Lihuaxuella thermophila]